MADIVNPKVSIVVPISSNIAFLDDCLKSIVTQTYENIEIICIDNGVQSEAVNIVNKYKANDSRVLYKLLPDASLAKLKNIGLDVSTGMFVMFVQATDFIEVDMVTGILRTAAKSVADVTLSAVWVHDNDTKNRVLVEEEYYTLSWLPQHLNKFCFTVSDIESKLLSFPDMCWAKLYNMDFIRQTGIRFPENLFYEDDIFIMNVLYNSKKMAVDSRQLYNYRINFEKVVEPEYNKHYADILEVMDELDRILKLFPFYAQIKDEFWTYRISRILGEFEQSRNCVKREFYKKIQQSLLADVVSYENEKKLEKIGCASLYNMLRNEPYYKYKIISTVKNILFKKNKK